MQTPAYDPSGSYIALAGFVVTLLGYFGILASASQIVQIIGGIAALYGIIASYLAHKKQAVASGAIPKQ